VRDIDYEGIRLGIRSLIPRFGEFNEHEGVVKRAKQLFGSLNAVLKRLLFFQQCC